MAKEKKIKNIPYHLGIILDGNRRWAKEKGLSSFQGHRKGLGKVEKTIDWCKKKGIKILTLFVFSTENWKRSKQEVDYLMDLLAKMLSAKTIEKINKKQIKIKVIGLRDKLPKYLKKTIKQTEELTKNNKEMIVNFALSYGGRVEIIEAVKKIIKNKIPASEINEDVIKDNLWTSDVDLVIRTGKEQRISNFLIWQLAYSELFFYKKYWPDFEEKDLDKALLDYASRQRRRGK